MYSKVLRIIVLVTLVRRCFGDTVLKHTLELDFGRYFSWTLCAPDSYAKSFEIMTDKEEKNFSDEQGLTGLRLYCAAKNGTEIEPIKSYNVDSEKMNWKGKNSCPPGEWLNGFRVRVQQKSGVTGDDTGANNIEMICSNNTVFNGRGTNKGDWSDWVYCPNGEFIYGLRTRAEERFTLDKVGLVAFEMVCGNMTGVGRTTEDPSFVTAVITDLYNNNNVTFPPFTNNRTSSFFNNTFTDRTTFAPFTNRTNTNFNNTFFTNLTSPLLLTSSRTNTNYNNTFFKNSTCKPSTNTSYIDTFFNRATFPPFINTRRNTSFNNTFFNNVTFPPFTNNSTSGFFNNTFFNRATIPPFTNTRTNTNFNNTFFNNGTFGPFANTSTNRFFNNTFFNNDSNFPSGFDSMFNTRTNRSTNLNNTTNSFFNSTPGPFVGDRRFNATRDSNRTNFNFLNDNSGVNDSSFNNSRTGLDTGMNEISFSGK